MSPSVVLHIGDLAARWQQCHGVWVLMDSAPCDVRKHKLEITSYYYISFENARIATVSTELSFILI